MDTKYHIRVPTKDQYAFIEAELAGTPADALEEYNELKRLTQVEGGIEDKRWREILDGYLTTGKMQDGGDFYEELSAAQKWLVQEVKKSFARTEQHKH